LPARDLGRWGAIAPDTMKDSDQPEFIPCQCAESAGARTLRFSSGALSVTITSR
jgi:hypothetical protein